MMYRRLPQGFKYPDFVTDEQKSLIYHALRTECPIVVIGENEELKKILRLLNLTVLGENEELKNRCHILKV